MTEKNKNKGAAKKGPKRQEKNTKQLDFSKEPAVAKTGSTEIGISSQETNDKMNYLLESTIEMSADFSDFDFKKPTYVEIHRGNIYHYFSSGLIKPAKYISNRAFSDLQSIRNDNLLLANSYSMSDSDDLVLLEVVLFEQEMRNIVVKENYAYLYQPIPISRITNIYVKNKAVKETIISESIVFDGGFIPERLVKESFPEEAKKARLEITDQEDLHKVDYGSSIDRFDRILGLLAFIRNYNLLISEKTNSYKTFPNHFFYAIQSIDNKFGTNIVPNNVISEFYTYLFNDTCPNDKQLLRWLFDRLKILDNFNDEDIKEFEQLYDRNTSASEKEKIVTESFYSLTKSLERKSVLEKMETIRSKSALPLYLFAYLRNYANLNSVELSRRDLPSVYSAQFGEYAFSLLGYFFGYTNLRNTDDRIDGSNPILKLVDTIPKKPPIKFQLTTEFDYVLIELVFNHCFLGGINPIDRSRLNMDDLISEKMTGTNLDNKGYKLLEFLVYGKLYQRITPDDPFSEILLLIDKLPTTIPLLSEFGIYCFRLGLKFRPISISDFTFSIIALVKSIGFSKEELIRFVRENKKKIDIEELKTRINFSQQYKEM